jgi:hypothetical protein
VVYDLANEEADLERRHLAKGGNSNIGVGMPGLNEEVFLAQLHRRSLLLNDEFQDAVMGVVMSHVASELEMTTMDETVSNWRSCSSSSSVNGAPLVNNHRQARWSRQVLLRSSSSAIADLTCTDLGGPTRSASDALRRGSLLGASDFFTENTSSDGPRGTTVTCRFSDGINVVEVFPAPIKTLGRMKEKVLEYSAEAVICTAGGKSGIGWPQTARILDPVRSSIVCDGPAHILEAFKWFSAGCEGCPSKPICRFKNRFSFAKEELLGGYEFSFRGR